MNPLPTVYLHLESLVMLLFLGVVVWAQFGRASDPGYYVQRGRVQLWLLAAAFLLMTVAFSASLAQASPLLGMELAAGIILSLLHPVNALCFMIHIQILRPWEIEIGNPVLLLLPRLVVVLCLLSWLIHPKQHARQSVRNLRGVLFLLGFTIWLFISTVKAADPAKALGYFFDVYFKSLTVFIMVLFLIESDRSVWEVEMTLVVSSLSLMSVGLYQFFTNSMSFGRLQSAGVFGDPNDMAAIIVMALPFALVPLFFDETSGLIAKTAGLSYAALAAFVIWLSASRGAMLALAAQIVIFRWVKSGMNRLKLFLMTAGAGAAYMGLLHFIHRDAADMATSENSRKTIWIAGINMALHNPILGVGYHQFAANYESHVIGTVYEWGRKTAHSSWILALGETGFVGFFLFVAFFISVARIAWRNKDKRPAQFYAVVGYGVAMSFLSHTYSPYFYLLMALVLASSCVRPKPVDGA